ncbi:MAG: NADH-quinone oxidoreductase subunit C [Bacillota bacterium]|nr:NADH-quinone oxidoreductase subunit C [Bacillota bacterium]
MDEEKQPKTPPKKPVVKPKVEAASGPVPLTPRQEEGLQRLKEKFPFVERDEKVRSSLGIQVPPEHVKEVLGFLRDDPFFRCRHLSCLSAVDWGEAIEVAYHLVNIEEKADEWAVTVKLPYQGDELPEVDSITDLWPGADWHEREAYDLVGVRFKGHPDLRRILLPEGFAGGHPLRKSFVDRRPPRQRLVRIR